MFLSRVDAKRGLDVLAPLSTPSRDVDANDSTSELNSLDVATPDLNTRCVHALCVHSV